MLIGSDFAIFLCRLNKCMPLFSKSRTGVRFPIYPHIHQSGSRPGNLRLTNSIRSFTALERLRLNSVSTQFPAGTLHLLFVGMFALYWSNVPVLNAFCHTLIFFLSFKKNASQKSKQFAYIKSNNLQSFMQLRLGEEGIKWKRKK